MKRIFLGILILVIALSGCSLFSSKKSSRRINPDDLVVKLEEKETVVDNEVVNDGTVVDAHKLKRGGQVIVTPFSPGADIEANDEFDRITLKMIRGMADEFSKETSKFDLLPSEKVDDADFIIEGRVTEMQKPSMMKGVMLKNNRYRMAIQGKLIDRDTDKPIAIFSDEVVGKNKKDTLDVLSIKIGRHIARFLATGGSSK